MQYKLGRKPRGYNPAIPHYSALRMRLCGTVTPIPAYRAWSKGMPDNLGYMLNDNEGDCVEAGVYHRLQVQSFVTTGKMNTQPDSVVQGLYEQFGYVPWDESTDNGTSMQALLTYWLNTGIPLADGSREKLIAFFEVDPTNQAHLREVINDCGGVYLGINLPAAVTELYPQIWDVPPGGEVAGGHCIYGTDYGVGPDSRFQQDGITVNSWGTWNLITPQTYSYFEEAYALVTRSWVETTGKTPLNMTAEQLEEQMQALRVAA